VTKQDARPDNTCTMGSPTGHNGAVYRVLIVSPYGTTAGGAEQWLLGILGTGALSQAGWGTDAIVMQQGPLQEALRQEHVTAITLPIPASPAGIARRVPALRRAILARDPSVVVANGVKAQLAVSMALAGTGIPTVWVKHDHSYDSTLAPVLGRSATLVVPTALEVGLATGRTDLIVIEPPRPPEPLPAAQARHALIAHGWTQSTRLTLGMITRLVPYKGVDLAIEALADDRCQDWELVVVGGDDPATPDESQRLTTLAAGLGIAERVSLVGPITAAGQLLTAVDAVAVLTRPGQAGAPTKEGYGIVASEAMLAGVPVVVAQEGPISRRLNTPTGPAGLTLPRPDAAALADALYTLSEDSVRTKMGKRGIAAGEALPTQDDVARQFLDVITVAAEL